MVPLVSGGAAGAEEEEQGPQDEEYLVPAILTLLEAGSVTGVEGSVQSDIPSLSCRIVFAEKSVAANWKRTGAMASGDVVENGFLPHGVFARIVGMAVSQCQRFCGDNMDPSQLELRANFAGGLGFGDHRFSLREHQLENTIEVLIHVENTLVVIESLGTVVTELIKTAMPELEALFAVPTADRKYYCLIHGEHGLLERVAKNRSAPQLLVPLLSSSKQALGDVFRAWLPPSGLISHYDAFISYR